MGVVHGQDGASAEDDAAHVSPFGMRTSFAPASARRWRSQALRDVGERDALEVDDDVAAGDVLAQAPVGLAPHLVRRVQVHEAAHVERLRADRGRGEAELGPGEVADLDVAAELRGGAHGGDRRLAPQAVDGHVDPAAGGLAEALGQVAVAVERDDRVGAALAQPLEPLDPRARRRPRGRRRAASPPAPRRCRPGRWRRARAPSPPAAGPRARRAPASRRGRSWRARRRPRRRGPSGTSNSVSAFRERALRHRAVRRDRLEQHAAPVLEPTPTPSPPTTDGSGCSR